MRPAAPRRFIMTARPPGLSRKSSLLGQGGKGTVLELWADWPPFTRAGGGAGS